MKILQYDLQKLMSLQSIYITYQQYFYKLNNYFRFGPIGPLISISSYNHVYLCYGKFHTINATNENFTI